MKPRKFGSTLRTVRERRKLTLKEVARKAGVSESLISQIERDKVSPSIDTLLNITEVLGIHPEYLFRGMDPEVALQITRKNEGAQLVEGAVTYRSLCSRSKRGTEEPRDQGIEVFKLEIKPGGSRGSIEYGHRGFEIGVILEGKALFYYGNERVELETGDCVSFTSDIPHTIQNDGPDILVSLWYVSPIRIFKA